MEREQEGAGNPRVAGIAGLIGVRSGQFYYVGKIDREADAEVKQRLGTTYVALKDAYEMLFQHRPTPEGLQLIEMPLPIPPFSGATKVTVRADAIFDLSTESSMVKFDKAMTGGSGLVLPGGPLRR